MMSVLGRAGWAAAIVVAGASIGAAIGEGFSQAVPGTAIGAVAAALAVAVWDALSAERLMRWLRDPRPPLPGRLGRLWGELGQRIERGLRERERQAADERNTLAQFYSAIEASPNGVLLLDANDQIDWCNSVAADHFGIDPRRDRLQRVTNLVRYPAFVALLQGGDFSETVQVPRDLERRTLAVSIRPYGDRLKLVLSHDITERERAEAMRRDFVANVSHEIRTPLTVVAGFVETLATMPLAEPERARVLALMSAQTRRMKSLVDDLLTLAQLEGSPRPGPDTWLDAAALIRRAVTDASALSAGRHTIAADPIDPLQIAGSDAEVSSALTNLLGNAVRYTPAGGQVMLHCRWRDDGGVEIEVADTGIGVSREHLPRLTERFYRVDSSRSRDSGGTGLGLAIVKHVMQRHGGEIRIESEPGRGSRFALVFPPARVRRGPRGDEPDGPGLPSVPARADTLQ
jgi:two-component system phosphate regulon sensor histidine kinase PhoR